MGHAHEDSLRKLVDWITAGGGRCGPLHLEDSGVAGRCLHASDPVAAGEILAHVPNRFIITREVAEASEIGKAITASGIERVSRDSRIAAFLLEERRRGRSFYQPYLDSLPASFPSMPLHYSRQDLALLKGSYALQLIERMRRGVVRDYILLRRSIPGFDAFGLDDFVWARIIVASRIFGLFIGGERQGALVPFVELLNHKVPRETQWSYEDEVAGVLLTALRPFERGEPIHTGYGNKCNSDFLLCYGFVLDENQNNEVSLPLSLPEDDPHYATKLAALGSEGPKRMFRLPVGYVDGSKIVFRFLRLALADDKEIAHLTARGRLTTDRLGPISARNEMAVLRAIATAAGRVLAGFDTTLEEDNALLRDLRLPPIVRTCVMMRRGEKRVLDHYLRLARVATPLLRLPLSELQKVVAARHSGGGEHDSYVQQVIVKMAAQRARFAAKTT